MLNQYDNKRRLYYHFVIINICTFIFYLSLLLMTNILIENKIEEYDEGFYLIFIMVFLILNFFVISSLIICNVFVSEKFDPINLMFGNLSRTNVFLKIVCFVIIMICIRTINKNIELIILMIISSSLSIDFIFISSKYHIIKNVEEIKLLSLIDKLTTISDEELSNYKNSLKRFNKLFFIIVCTAPVLKYLFIDTIYILSGFTIYIVLISLFSYKAYVLVFTKKDMIRRLFINICISFIGVFLIIGFYTKIIVLTVYPIISPEELILLFIIFLIPYIYPSAKIYNHIKIYTLKNK